MLSTDLHRKETAGLIFKSNDGTIPHTQLSDVIDRQQNLEKTNMKLREGTHEVTFVILNAFPIDG